MNTDTHLSAATAFMATHARILDRRRFDVLVGDGAPEAVLAAVDGYRNPDGGYGWGLEPDLRSPESQPGGALHAFEAFVEDTATREFIRANNQFGYDELIAKFNEARERGYWQPRSNRAHEWLERP